MGRDQEARLIADQLVYARQREWSGVFTIDRLKLRDLISKEMIDHASVCSRMALRLKRIRDARLKAIADCVAQNKGDDLVRAEIVHILESPPSEFDTEKGEGES